MRSLGRLISAALATASVMLVATPASAVVMLASFSGVVGPGSDGNLTYDTGDFFGLGTGLVGASFTASFKYDTSRGQPVTIDPAATGFGEDTRYGGPNWACAPTCVSPILAAYLTINGVTDEFNVTRNGSANVVINPLGWKQTFFYSDFFQGSDGNALQLYVLNAPAPLLLTTPYTGGNEVSDARPATNAFALGVVAGTRKNYRLALSPLSTTLAPVPEPATWGLMIIGFAATGAMLRSRRQVLARV